MSKPDGTIIIKADLDTENVKSGIPKLKADMNSLSGVATKAMKGVAKAFAAALSVKAIADFSKEAIKLGSALQEVQNVVDVTFTTMNDEINEFAKNAAKTAGLSETMAKQYAGSFGAMAKSFGFAEQSAYTMATSLTQLSGDVASFYNISQDMAYTKLKSVFSGETESLKDLGIVMTQTALDDFAMRKGLKKTTSQMSEQEKVALRYQFILENLQGATGDFVRTQDGWANQTRVLSLQFDQLKATIGQGLIMALTPVIQVINDIIASLQTLADKFRDFMASVFGGSSGSDVSGMLGDAASNAYELADGITAAGNAAKKSLAGFDEISRLSEPADASSATSGASDIALPGITVPYEEVESATDGLIAKITEAMESIKQSLEPYAELFLPTIDAWRLSFEGFPEIISPALEQIRESFSGLMADTLAPFAEYLITQFIPDVSNTFSQTLAPIFTDVMAAAIQIFASDFENTCLWIDELCNNLTTAFELVKKIFTDMCESMSAGWDEHGGSILDGIIEFKDGLWETIWYIYDSIVKPVIDNCTEMVSWLWDKHLKPLWDDLVEFALSTSENILTLWNKVIKPVVDRIVAYVAPPITAVINGIIDAVSIVVAIVSDVVGAIITILDGCITFLTGVFTLDFDLALEGLKKIFTGMVNEITGVVEGFVNAIIWGINQVIALVYSGVAGLINTVGKTVEQIGGWLGKDWGFSVPTEPPKIDYIDIPKLAQGAVLPANQPFMALVGDQKHGTNVEAPLSVIQEAVMLAEEDRVNGMMAGFEALLDEVQRLRAAVEGIEVGDSTIGQAANRYNQRMAVIRG